MGYYTQFEFEFRGGTEADFVRALKATCEAAYEEYEYATQSSAKWYDHEVEIKAASKLIPDVYIIVDGHGEQAGDVWRKFFKNGKVEVHKWAPPEFPSGAAAE